MKKVILMLLTLLSIFSLTGCGGSTAAVKVKDGAIYYGKHATELTEYIGHEAKHDFGEDVSIRYYMCDDGPNECIHNLMNVLEENMTSMGKAKYYTLYLGTYVYMYYPAGDGYIEGEAIINNDTLYTSAQVASIMLQDMEDFQLTFEPGVVNYEGCVEIDANLLDVKVRPSEVVVPQLLRIRMDNGATQVQESRTFGDIVVGYSANEKYEYYKHRDVVVQVAKGADIQSLVRFIGE